MPSTSSYRSGTDFRVFVQDAMAARDAVPVVRPSLAARLRRFLRRRVTAELAFCRDVGAAAAERLRPGSPPRRQENSPKREMKEADWSAELAREYREEFLPPRPERRLAAQTPEETPGRAGALFSRAGRALWLSVSLFRPLIRPLARMFFAGSGLFAKVAVAGIALLAGTDLLEQWRQTSQVHEQSAPAAARDAWIEIGRPYELYDLPARQLAHEKLAYSARRHATGGGREDTLTFGRFGTQARAFLRLSVYRHGAEMIMDAPFYVAMARSSAPLGLSVSNVRLEQAQPTRFGEMEQAALILADKSGSRTNCRGFRLVRDEPGLTLSGLACAAGEETMSAPDLACLVDRLDLLAAGSDRPLRDFFGAAAARNVQGCDETGRRR